mmetsp:Transcript_19400/g.54488  ORF Transcript_19400/g.54488 Transcript_19400/m.54488 type:complete len:550 (+) Transcript_19400:189-1838(+)
MYFLLAVGALWMVVVVVVVWRVYKGFDLLSKRKGFSRDQQGRSVAIIGAGFGGLCAGIKLKKLGIPFVIYERHPTAVGGTWRDNTYPGSGCDVASLQYEFSFFRGTWSRLWARQSEILDYTMHLYNTFQLGPHTTLDACLTRASFDGKRWSLTFRRESDGGQFVTDDHSFLIIATGQLSDPQIPAVLEQSATVFRGKVCHTARWPRDLDLVGKDVVVVGTGASAIQLVPEIVDRCRKLTVVQSSPNWLFGKQDRQVGAVERFLYQFSPIRMLYRYYGLLQLDLLFAASMRQQVPSRSWTHGMVEGQFRKSMVAQMESPVNQEVLLPQYPFGCKRVLLSSEWLAAVQAPNATVVEGKAVGFAPDGIRVAKRRNVRGNDEGVRAADCEDIPADIVVLATGFRTTAFLRGMEVYNRDGEEIHTSVWADGAYAAYCGIHVKRFPNLFLLYGPNTNVNHTSILSFLEAQTENCVDTICECLERGADLVVVPESLYDAQDAAVQQGLQKSIFNAGCQSWYVSKETGRVVTNTPWSLFGYWMECVWNYDSRRMHYH